MNICRTANRISLKGGCMFSAATISSAEKCIAKTIIPAGLRPRTISPTGSARGSSIGGRRIRRPAGCSTPTCGRPMSAAGRTEDIISTMRWSGTTVSESLLPKNPRDPMNITAKCAMKTARATAEGRMSASASIPPSCTKTASPISIPGSVPIGWAFYARSRTSISRARGARSFASERICSPLRASRRCSSPAPETARARALKGMSFTRRCPCASSGKSTMPSIPPCFRMNFVTPSPTAPMAASNSAGRCIPTEISSAAAPRSIIGGTITAASSA